MTSQTPGQRLLIMGANGHSAHAVVPLSKERLATLRGWIAQADSLAANSPVGEIRFRDGAVAFVPARVNADGPPGQALERWCQMVEEMRGAHEWVLLNDQDSQALWAALNAPEIPKVAEWAGGVDLEGSTCVVAISPDGFIRVTWEDGVWATSVTEVLTRTDVGKISASLEAEGL